MPKTKQSQARNRDKLGKFLPTPRHPTQKFCCDCGKPINKRSIHCPHCSGIWRWKTKHQLPSFPKGKNHWAWKGGRYRGGYKGKYWLILKPGHHRAEYNGYVMEHIVIWEEANNKLLPDGWLIHHLNGITDDNRPSNLVALPNKKHYLVLAEKAKRIQQLEALLSNQHQLL